METEPEPPPGNLRKLGYGFLVLLCFPIAVFVVWMEDFQNSEIMGIFFLILSVICAILSGLLVHRRFGRPDETPLGVLTGLGLLVLYGAAYFFGCAATLEL